MIRITTAIFLEVLAKPHGNDELLWGQSIKFI
jgi:hypothetical protein